jgi:SsrA-binding protein
MSIKVLARNRKAFHEYEVMETFEAGLVLQGTEVKSVRAGKIHLADGWVDITPRGEAFLMQVTIDPYFQGNIYNHKDNQPRKLLLNKKELIVIESHVATRGNSIIPLQVYLKKSLVKIEIALVRGKKLYDKRLATKKKDTQRDLEREHKVKVTV